MTTTDNGILSALGLTARQTEILYNMQREEIQSDIASETNPELKIQKQLWLRQWEKSIGDAYREAISDGDTEIAWSMEDELAEIVASEFASSPSKLWLHMVVLEASLFVPYFPLDDKEFSSKECRKLKYTGKYAWLKNFLDQGRWVQSSTILLYQKAYKKALDRITGKTQKLIISGAVTLAVTLLTFGIGALFAGPIAVALVGAQFAGLSGAALTSACLAYLGGGALAIGGAGMAGGAAAIAGGGALIGFGVGGAATAGGNIVSSMLSNKNYALSQAARLEVSIKEIILNTQHDVRCAQGILAQYKSRIEELGAMIASKEIELDANKKDLKNLKAVVEYLKKAYMESNKFTSAFEVGMNAEGR